MKKSYLFSALAAGMVLLSACSNDDNVANGSDNANDAKQQIVLQVANTGEGTTRAGRPLYSSEAKQSIENVKVIICNDQNTVVYADKIGNWQNDDISSVYKDNGHGREKTITLEGENKLEAGNYTVYAVGYSDNSDYADLNTKVEDIAKGGTFSDNTVLSINNGVKGEEIFAGSLNLEVKDGVGFNKPVVLNRQVAGTFGYFEEIPYVDGETTLQLVACDLNTQLVLGQFGNYDLTSNGDADANGTKVNYVINGATSATDKVVYSINLSEWFKQIENKDGLIDAANWEMPDKYKGVANFKTGSVFGGEFLVPFAKSTTTNTFVLQLTNGTKVLKQWVVKLPSSDKQLGEHTLYTWGNDTFTKTEKVQDTQTNYNVVRNHLYGIGQRALDNPDKPGQPDPGTPDKPQSLNNKQELVLKVNDNWEVLHIMEIE